MQTALGAVRETGDERESPPWGACLAEGTEVTAGRKATDTGRDSKPHGPPCPLQLGEKHRKIPIPVREGSITKSPGLRVSA